MQIKVLMLTVVFALSVSAVSARDLVAPSFDQDVIDDAVAAALLYYPASAASRSATALQYMAMVCYLDSDAEATDETTLASRIILHFQNVIQGGKEPKLWGGHFAWNEAPLGGAIALAKNTPAVWDSLTSTEQDKLTLIMDLGAVVGNIQHNGSVLADESKECHLAMSLNTTPYSPATNYNPNQRNPMVAWMSYAYIFYGSAAAVNSMLSSFSLASAISDMTTYGWTNLLATFNTTYASNLVSGTDQSSGGVYCYVPDAGAAEPFTFVGRRTSGAMDCPGWYDMSGTELAYTPMNLLYRSIYEYAIQAEVVETACSPAVQCNDGQFYAGTPGEIPHLGEVGFPLELNIGTRTSLDYASWHMVIDWAHYATVVVSGYLDPDNADHAVLHDRMDIAWDVFTHLIDNNYWYDASHSCQLWNVNESYLGIDFVRDAWDAIEADSDFWSGSGEPAADVTISVTYGPATVDYGPATIE